VELEQERCTLSGVASLSGEVYVVKCTMRQALDNSKMSLMLKNLTDSTIHMHLFTICAHPDSAERKTADNHKGKSSSIALLLFKTWGGGGGLLSIVRCKFAPLILSWPPQVGQHA